MKTTVQHVVTVLIQCKDKH